MDSTANSSSSLCFNSLTSINSAYAGDVLFGNVKFDTDAAIAIDGGSCFYAARMSVNSPVTINGLFDDAPGEFAEIPFDGVVIFDFRYKADAIDYGATASCTAASSFNWF